MTQCPSHWYIHPILFTSRLAAPFFSLYFWSRVTLLSSIYPVTGHALKTTDSEEELTWQSIYWTCPMEGGEWKKTCGGRQKFSRDEELWPSQTRIRIPYSSRLMTVFLHWPSGWDSISQSLSITGQEVLANLLSLLEAAPGTWYLIIILPYMKVLL